MPRFTSTRGIGSRPLAQLYFLHERIRWSEQGQRPLRIASEPALNRDPAEHGHLGRSVKSCSLTQRSQRIKISLSRIASVPPLEDKPPKLDPAEAYAVIQALLDEHDTISRTNHARDQMLKRGFTFDDVKNVLRKGAVSSDPEWDDTFKNWKYKVRGRDCEGVHLTVVIALQPKHARLTLITGF